MQTGKSRRVRIITQVGDSNIKQINVYYYSKCCFIFGKQCPSFICHPYRWLNIKRKYIL